MAFCHAKSAVVQIAGGATEAVDVVEAAGEAEADEIVGGVVAVAGGGVEAVEIGAGAVAAAEEIDVRAEVEAAVKEVVAEVTMPGNLKEPRKWSLQGTSVETLRLQVVAIILPQAHRRLSRLLHLRCSSQHLQPPVHLPGCKLNLQQRPHLNLQQVDLPGCRLNLQQRLHLNLQPPVDLPGCKLNLSRATALPGCRINLSRVLGLHGCSRISRRSRHLLRRQLLHRQLLRQDLRED